MRRFLSIALLTTFFQAYGAPAERFEIIDLTEVGAGLTAAFPRRINDQGVVVGAADFGDGDGLQGAVWHGDRVEKLVRKPGDDYSEGLALNDRGVVAGSSNWIEEHGRIQIIHSAAVAWLRGRLFEIAGHQRGGPDYELLWVNDINNKGAMVIFARDPLRSLGRATLSRRSGVLEDLGTLGGSSATAFALNDRGQVVGQAWTAGGQNHAFLWQDGVMTDLGTFGGRDSQAFDINEAGQIVGGAQSPTAPLLAFLWENGELRNLGTLGGNQSHATGINDRVQIVGFSTDAQDNAHAFFWEAGEMVDPLARVPQGRGWGGRANAGGINNAAQFVGTAWREVGDHGYVMMPVDLALGEPVPGRAGEENAMRLSGAKPGATIALYYGTEVGLTQIPGCPGAPLLAAGGGQVTTAVADASGQAEFRAWVPAGAAGRVLRIQAFEDASCLASNVVVAEF